MAERIRIQNLLRLTLCRKGKSTAKHPLLQAGVIEVIKSSQIGTVRPDADSEPTWLTPVNANLERYRTGHWG